MYSAWQILVTGQGYGSIIPDAPQAEADPLTEKLAEKVGKYVEQYIEAMEKVIKIYIRVFLQMIESFFFYLPLSLYSCIVLTLLYVFCAG